MNKIVIYDFTIKAVSPLHLGTGQEGQESKLVKNSQGKPVLPGNSLGGALREYLKETEALEEIVRKYMGGVKPGEDRQEIFITSGVYISDGKIEGDVVSRRKEGTAVNPAYGAAERHSKYTLEYLPEGTEISFRIEGDVCDGKEQEDAQGEEKLSAAELEKIIGTWAQGFATQALVLGGQKSNGFGRCELKKLEKTVFPLDNSRSLDEYIFQRKDLRESRKKTLVWKDLAYYSLTKRSTVVFSMRGVFPYGVYQSFPIEESGNTNADPTGEPPGKQLTGLLQKGNDYFIPSTSLKGIIKNEIRLLLRRMTGQKLVAAKLEDLFGGEKNRGRLVFSDLRIADGKPVEVERYLKNNQERWEARKGQPVYIKIDRLTGGAFDSALKHQQEIQGSAEIRFELTEQSGWDHNPHIFPLVYALRRIGAGTVPLGGRTVIDLGQFTASKVNIAAGNTDYAIETGRVLSQENRRLLEYWFESFKRWCNDENASAL